MISVEQIHQLESKVLQAVDTIKSLREENALLKDKLSGYEKRIDELEVLIDSFKKDQSNIEEGIINALHQLDVLEDIISEPVSDEESEKEAAPLFRQEDNTGGNTGTGTESVSKESSVSEKIEDEPADDTETSENELDIF